MHGGWLVFDLWELCSSFLRKKHHPAPMLFCQLKHANYIGSPPTAGTSSPKQNRPTKQFFVRISTLYFQKTSKKGGVFGEFTTLASPPKKKKSPRSARARIRIQRGSRRCSTWYLDLCPLAPPPPIPSLRYLKGPWSIFDTVAMGIFWGLKDFPN